MKKFIFLFVLVLSCLFFLSCTEDTSSDEILLKNSSTILEKGWPNKGSVTVAWSIGRKTKNCGGIGICKRTKTEVDLDGLKIDVIELEKTLEFYSRVSNSYESNSDNSQLFIEVDPISAEFLKKQNGGYKIILEEDFVFENEYKELFLNKDYIVKKGIYDLVLNKKSGKYETYF